MRNWENWVENLTLHHITPKREKKINDHWNLVTLCQRCHKCVEISNKKQWVKFREELEILAESRKPKITPIYRDTSLAPKIRKTVKHFWRELSLVCQ